MVIYTCGWGVSCVFSFVHLSLCLALKPSHPSFPPQKPQSHLGCVFSHQSTPLTHSLTHSLTALTSSSSFSISSQSTNRGGAATAFIPTHPSMHVRPSIQPPRQPFQPFTQLSVDAAQRRAGHILSPASLALKDPFCSCCCLLFF